MLTKEKALKYQIYMFIMNITLDLMWGLWTPLVLSFQSCVPNIPTTLLGKHFNKYLPGITTLSIVHGTQDVLIKYFLLLVIEFPLQQMF